jgi:hypothetical protein
MRPRKGFNKYEINGDEVTFYIYNRKKEEYKAFISLCDLEKLIKFNHSWFLKWSKTTKKNYVAACEYLGTFNGKPKYKTHHLHRFLVDAAKKTHVDHINYDPLDNRRKNLRVTNTSNNNKHRGALNINNSTGYRNVSKIGNWYVVQLQDENGNNMQLGKFKDVHKAGEHAEKMRQKYYKEFA